MTARGPYRNVLDWQGARRRWIQVARMHREGMGDSAIAAALDMRKSSVEAILDKPLSELRKIAADLGEAF